MYWDVQGSGVVHLTGGISGLVGAIIVRPRAGRFQGNAVSFEAHNLPLAVSRPKLLSLSAKTLLFLNKKRIEKVSLAQKPVAAKWLQSAIFNDVLTPQL